MKTGFVGSRHPAEGWEPWTTITRRCPCSQVLPIYWKSSRSVFHPPKATPARLDAMPTPSSMDPSLRRDDDSPCARRSLRLGHRSQPSAGSPTPGRTAEGRDDMFRINCFRPGCGRDGDLTRRAGIPMEGTISRPDGRSGKRRKAAGEESPGSIDMRCRITSGGGNPRDSATENEPPSSALSGRGRARVKGCGKSAPRLRQRNRQDRKSVE